MTTPDFDIFRGQNLYAVCSVKPAIIHSPLGEGLAPADSLCYNKKKKKIFLFFMNGLPLVNRIPNRRR